MAFIVETGSGLTNANSYGSTADFLAYWLTRGVDLSAQTLADQQSSLVLATDHIDLFFGPDLLGFKATSAQALQFPRTYLYDVTGALITGIPLHLQYALFEYGKRVILTEADLAPDPTVDPSGLQVLATFKKVGPLEKRTNFTGSSPQLLPSYPKADAYMEEFIGRRGGSYRA